MEKKITKKQVTISTTKYRWSQGHEPKGQGNWAFSENLDSEVLWFYGTYAEAKKQAITYAASNGITNLIVLP